MIENNYLKPLGKVLQLADLISTSQIESALEEQTKANNLRLGEILALRGWLKQETADFFAQQWPNLPNQTSQKPLGYYLQQAGLLDEVQINTILSEQAQTGMRFGELVIMKGWLKQQTINFFLEYIAAMHQQHEEQNGQYNDKPQIEQFNMQLPSSQEDNSKIFPPIPENNNYLISPAQEQKYLQILQNSNIQFWKLDIKGKNPDVLLEEVLSWTAGEPFLTLKVCQLLSLSNILIHVGEEATKVREIVQTKLIENWETQVASRHLQNICRGLLQNQQYHPSSLLRLYQQILHQGQVLSNDTPLQAALLDLGLVVQDNGYLKVANRIYESVFNRAWLNQELSRLRPFEHSTIKLFKLSEKATYPEVLLSEVLSWTGTQSFLIQKLCQLLSNFEGFIAPGEEAETVRKLVQNNFINNWSTQLAAEHLQTIANGLLENQNCDPLSLLNTYKQILRQGEIPQDDSLVQAELLNLGLVVQNENSLKVANRIYQSVFNLSWVESKLKARTIFSDVLIAEVLSWTDGEPFLTQKLCQLLSDSEDSLIPGNEAAIVQQLVETCFLNHWSTKVAAEHLQNISRGIMENPNCEPLALLRDYQLILYRGELFSDKTPTQLELLSLGLVTEKDGYLRVANRIYQSVFNRDWVNQQLHIISQTQHAPQTADTEITPVYPEDSIAISPVESNFYQPRKNLFLSLGIGLGIAVLLLIGFYLYKYYRVRTIFQQGNELFNKGEHAKAIDKYNQLLKIDSNYYQAWTNRGYTLAGLRDYYKMLESCSTATIIEPKAVLAWNCQGEALHNLHQYDQAVLAFDKAIALDPKDPIFLINKTDALLELKQTETALETINQAIDLLTQKQAGASEQAANRELSIAHSYKGRVLLQKQDNEAALSAYEQSLTFDSNYFTAKQGKGIALNGLKRYDEAIAQFQELLSNPQLTHAQRAETMYYLGLNFCRAERTTEAFAAFESALKLKPDYQEVQFAKQNCSDAENRAPALEKLPPRTRFNIRINSTNRPRIWR